MAYLPKRSDSTCSNTLLLVSGRLVGVVLGGRLLFGGRVGPSRLGPARLGPAAVLLLTAAQAHVLLVLLLHLLDFIQVQAYAVTMEPVVAAPTPDHEPEIATSLL